VIVLSRMPQAQCCMTQGQHIVGTVIERVERTGLIAGV